MTRPALASLAVLLAVPLSAAPPASRCPGLEAVKDKISAPAGDWTVDLGKTNPACDDAVWRVASEAQWDKAADVAAQKALLAKIAAALAKYDQHSDEGVAAAKAVYEAGIGAGIVTALKPGEGKVAGKAYEAVGIEAAKDPAPKSTGDPDKDAAADVKRRQALAGLIVPGVPKQATLAGGTPGVTAETPAKPAALVVAFYKALDAARADLKELAALGVKVVEVPALIRPESPTGLSLKLNERVKQLAEAKDWSDEDGTKGALMAFKDRAKRNAWAMHAQSVDYVYKTAERISGPAAGLSAGIDVKKKAEMEEINAKLRANVASAIGVAEARRAFDGEVAHNAAYAGSSEGVYRANQLKSAQASADSVRVVEDGKGKYKVEYSKDGGATYSTAKTDIPDLKAAEAAAGEITTTVSDEIMKGHPMLAKTKAAMASFMGGDVPPPLIGTPKAAYTDYSFPHPWGCKKDGETLDEFKARNNSAQMEGAAETSARRQAAERTFLAEMRQANKEFEQNKTLMSGGEAQKIYDARVLEIKKKYKEATPEGSRDQVIANRTAANAVTGFAADGEFVALIKEMAPQIKENLPAALKAGKYPGKVSAVTVDVLLRPIPNPDTNVSTTVFDEFYAQEWTAEGSLDANARLCKDTFRAGEYASLEPCAADSLKVWVSKRKAGNAPAAEKKPADQKPVVKAPASKPLDPKQALEDADSDR